MTAYNVIERWLEYERNFDGQTWIEFTREHAEIPIFAVAAYLFIVFYVPPVLEKREKFNLKTAFASWNLFLAVFSTIGAYLRGTCECFEFSRCRAHCNDNMRH